jgi:hypothetical protein
MPICDATVTLQGSGSDAVVDGGAVVSTDPSACGFATVYAPAGNYDVIAAAPGYQNGTVEIQVTIDACEARHIAPEGPRAGLPGFGDTVSIGLKPR